MTRLNLVAAGVMVLGAVSLAACQPAAAPTEVAPTDALTGNWTLVSYGPAAAPVPLPAGVEVTAKFTDGSVMGRSGCNNYIGTYTLDGNNITIMVGIATMTACPEPQMRVNAEYMAALETVTGYLAPDGGLTLHFGNGQVLIFATTGGLTGTSWSVTDINSGHQGVVTLAYGTEISLLFAGGQATGKACNNYFGLYSQNGDKVTIGPLANTRMICPEKRVMEQEMMYFTALQESTTWSIAGSKLTLRDATGATRVIGNAVMKKRTP